VAILSEVQLGAIMRMADSLARELEATCVTDEHILLALEEQDYRLNYLVEQSDQVSSTARSCCRPTVKRLARSTAFPSSGGRPSL
jgi:predicted ATP-dependent protease